MSEILFDMPFEKIMQDGQVVLTYDGCLELAKRNKSFHEYFVTNDERFRKYNRYTDNKLTVFDGQPAAYTKRWVLPDAYVDLDIRAYCAERLAGKPQIYFDRLDREMIEFEKRDMVDLLRFIKFFVEVLNEQNMVRGVGRGSSCASLVLYVLDVNRIDPVRYDIPLEEFLR
jgi:DNA polymerase III alpha subunit